MVRSGRKHLFVAVLAGFALFAIPLAALANPFGINIFGPGPYGGAGITIKDGDPADLDPLPNQIIVTAGAHTDTPAIPGFSASVDTALTNSPGAPAGSFVVLTWTLSSLGTLVGGGGTVQVTASVTDFLFPPTWTPSILTSIIGGNIGPGTGSVTGQQWVNLSNTFFEGGPVTGITPGPHGPFPPASFSETKSIGFTSATPYSITDRVILTLGDESLTSGSLTSLTIREPSALLLLGAGLVGVAMYARRRLNGRK